MMETELKLADQRVIRICAANGPPALLMARLAQAMQLAPATKRACQSRVIVEPGPDENAISLAFHEDTLTCRVDVSPSAETMALNMQDVAQAIGMMAEREGALLLHGGLADLDGRGIVLAGPGGMGKTTAGRRLPPPWRCWSDDATLIVRDAQGVYWAHPWPTWSRFFFDGPGGSWDVTRTVPLAGIFFLDRGLVDQIEPLRAAAAACHLSSAAEAVASPRALRLAPEESRAVRLRRFDFISPLARAVPCYHLYVTLTGAFWQKVEEALAQNGAYPFSCSVGL